MRIAKRREGKASGIPRTGCGKPREEKSLPRAGGFLSETQVERRRIKRIGAVSLKKEQIQVVNETQRRQRTEKSKNNRVRPEGTAHLGSAPDGGGIVHTVVEKATPE